MRAIGAAAFAVIAATAAMAVMAPPGAAQTKPVSPAASARAILEAAIDTAGGDVWLAPRTLALSGTATFYAPGNAEPVSEASDYRMWRALDPGRTVAHGPDGKVRITAKRGDSVMFDVGYDGATTWTDKGVMAKADADAYWAANFGFGIIRSALHDGFALGRAPDRIVDGHRVELVRITDPGGAPTLFGIDPDSHFIRYMGFRTPRGWHERTYDDFVMLAAPRWLQARTVTLYYDGIKANTVHWTGYRVGAPIDPAIFAPPAGLGPMTAAPH